jgi:hypothetical protein
MTTGDALFLALLFTPLGGIALLFIAALVAAIWVPKKTSKKVAALVVVLLLAALPIAYGVWERETKNAKGRAKFDEANAIFQERCKSAGEKIVRTVSNVEGVVLLKVRPEVRNTRDQFALTDPYGDDLHGDAYISTFLRSYNSIATEPPREIGYDYVDVADQARHIINRYTGSIQPPQDGRLRPTFKLHSTELDGGTTRYGVTYEDISTRDDRLHWIAGSSLRIIDMQTNEVIAERVGYMLDAGQGQTASGSEPWERATKRACPKFAGWPATHGQTAQAAVFAAKVLVPSNRR